jgi:hypothetical protein
MRKLQLSTTALKVKFTMIKRKSLHIIEFCIPASNIFDYVRYLTKKQRQHFINIHFQENDFSLHHIVCVLLSHSSKN